MRNWLWSMLLFLIGFQTLLIAKVFQMKSEPVEFAHTEGVVFMQPRWSPDGKQIAFTSANYQGIWVMDADGKNIQKITDDASAGFGFEWSHDAQAIVTRISKFEKFRRYHAVKLFDLAQNSEQLLSDFRTKMTALPHWSPTDEQIFLFNQNKLELFSTGKKVTQVNAVAADARVYFLKDEQPAEANLMTQEFKVFDQLNDKQCLNLVVSPDRKKIAFEILGDDLYVMNVDGTGLVNLGEGHRPQWAPDSEHLVFMITHDDGHQYQAADIATIKIDGRDKVVHHFRQDHLEMNPSWSPDGKKIAFDLFEEGRIMVIEITD